MIQNRTLGMDDYAAMFRRRWRMISALALVALLAGGLVSVSRPTYTSTSLLRVEKPPTLPAGIVKPPTAPTYLQINFRELSERLDRVIDVQGQVLSRSNLQGIVRRLGLDKRDKNVDAVIDSIQAGTSIAEVDLSTSLVGSTPSPTAVPYVWATPGFSISYTSENRNDTQRICSELTSSFLTEYAKARQRANQETMDFLTHELEEARKNLDEQDRKLALFRGNHLGQLPENVDENLRVLNGFNGLNSQMEASTQSLLRAQQDKAYEETLLDKEVTAWQSSPLNRTSDSIEQRLVELKTQLVALQTRYTDDHPEVVKMKSDIANLETKLKEVNTSTNQDPGTEMARKPEPAQILQLRQQIQQDEEAIERATREQKRLREMVATYQGRLTLSPEVEKEYNSLTRDSQIAHQIYDGLLSNKAESEMRTDLDQHQQGEELRILSPASFPVPPSFVQRWIFAGYGLMGGLTLGFAFALWLEFSDKTMRNEADVLAGAELPMLTAIPWVGPVVMEGGWRNRFKDLLGLKSPA